MGRGAHTQQPLGAQEHGAPSVRPQSLQHPGMMVIHWDCVRHPTRDVLSTHITFLIVKVKNVSSGFRRVTIEERGKQPVITYILGTQRPCLELGTPQAYLPSWSFNLRNWGFPEDLRHLVPSLGLRHGDRISLCVPG